ncbi:MAG: hypothetical protein U0X91_01735 [Spirosomataceae bacterium]
MKTSFITLFLMVSGIAFSQSRFSKNEISLNGFRNPSIGIEYRRHQLSFHAGYYITALQAGVTTKFLKTGITAWFLPLGKKENPSSFYAGASYLRGINLEYNKENALGLEAGFRWMVWKGLNLRIGGIALVAKGHDVRINPTPGISYSFFIK